ncbi:MAG: ABC transporter ATP-binding protein [Chloroflexota bacterium]
MPEKWEQNSAKPAVALPDYWALLRRYLGNQRGPVSLMAAMLLLSIGFQLAGPQVVRAFIDAAQRGAPVAALVRAAVLFLAVAAAQQGLTVLASYWSERVAWTAANRLRLDLAAQLLALDLGFHQVHTPGKLLERVDGDVNALAGFFSSFAVHLVGNALLLTGVLVALASVDRRLGLAFALFALLAVLLLGWVRRFGTPHWHADRQRSAAFYGYLGEMLTAREDLRSSGAVAYALRRFLEELRIWLPVTRRAAFWGQAVMMTGILIFAAGDALSYGMAGRLYLRGAISLGAVYLVVAYVAMLAQPIETIRTQLQDLQRADAGIARVRELLALRSPLIDGPDVLPPGALAVEFQGVSFAYPGEGLAGAANGRERDAVLDHVSFRLEAGRVLGLLGRTGSGKTTIARLLFRLYDPQHGSICLGNVDLQRLQLAALRGRVGLVTQEVQLFAASLRDNLTFFDTAVSDGQLRETLGGLGLLPWLARLPQGLDSPIAGSSLSAGEAQLLALARVFLKDPGLVILDEASSRLDPLTETLLEGALDRLLNGRTVIIIAHRLATIQRADTILILEGGRVQEQGRREHLAANPGSRLATLQRTRLEGTPA